MKIKAIITALMYRQEKELLKGGTKSLKVKKRNLIRVKIISSVNLVEMLSVNWSQFYDYILDSAKILSLE